MSVADFEYSGKCVHNNKEVRCFSGMQCYFMINIEHALLLWMEEWCLDVFKVSSPHKMVVCAIDMVPHLIPNAQIITLV